MYLIDGPPLKPPDTMVYTGIFEGFMGDGGYPMIAEKRQSLGQVYA